MTTVAPACWDDTSNAAHSVSIQHNLDILLLSYFSFWLYSILDQSAALLSCQTWCLI